jgi:hypothetical protein
MRFKQYKDGSCDIEFSWREIWIIVKRKKLHFDPEGLRHFGNVLVKIVSDWNLNFSKDIINKNTDTNTQIKFK